MKTIINEEGFEKAMAEGTPWKTFDCSLTELSKNGQWYWEIHKTVFKGKGVDPVHDIVSHGTDDKELTVITKIWDNLIEKENPDEYFAETNDHVDQAVLDAIQDMLNKEQLDEFIKRNKFNA